MVRERIPIRRIANAAARKVTFTKRRRGLFKKAHELSVLCDADVAIVIFTSTGKLFEYASSSMKDILERYKLDAKNLNKKEQPSSTCMYSVEDGNPSRLSKEVTERSQQLKLMRGDELQELSIYELHDLEKSLEVGLNRVLEKKTKKITDQITLLQHKGKQLMEDNERLKQQVSNTASSDGGRSSRTPESELVCQASELSEDASNSDNDPPRYYDSSDTSLKLRLAPPYKD